MNTKKTTLGLAVVAAVGASGLAAAANPFGMQSMERGYMVAQAGEGKCGAGKCGGNMKTTAKATEASCGGAKCSIESMDRNKDGKVSKSEFNRFHASMFSKMDTNKDGYLSDSEMGKMMDGMCGGAKAMDGKCGGAKMKEAKCGEGKCGGMK